MDNIFYFEKAQKAGLKNWVVNLILNGQYLLQEMGESEEEAYTSCRKPYSKWTISSTSTHYLSRFSIQVVNLILNGQYLLQPKHRYCNTYNSVVNLILNGQYLLHEGMLKTQKKLTM